MDEMLAEMPPDELRSAHRYIRLFEDCGMSQAEADEWRRRILAWQRFRFEDPGRRRPA